MELVHTPTCARPGAWGKEINRPSYYFNCSRIVTLISAGIPAVATAAFGHLGCGAMEREG